jgi:hypothetical protein
LLKKRAPMKWPFGLFYLKAEVFRLRSRHAPGRLPPRTRIRDFETGKRNPAGLRFSSQFPANRRISKIITTELPTIGGPVIFRPANGPQIFPRLKIGRRYGSSGGLIEED